MNFQQQEQFYQMIKRSKAGSTGTEDKMITEVVNGIITTRPANKIEYLDTTESEQGPEIIELGGKSKSGSVQGINKMKEIHNFIASNGRR